MKKENKIFAFVFARGGSKGLINKNLLPIGGIPLVGRSIKVAKKLEIIEKIFIEEFQNWISKNSAFLDDVITKENNRISSK